MSRWRIKKRQRNGHVEYIPEIGFWFFFWAELEKTIDVTIKFKIEEEARAFIREQQASTQTVEYIYMD